MRNHFIISYSGNKRNEVQNIYSILREDLEKVNTIIEPFCGTSAFSYYVANQQPKRFKYILNDNNPELIQLYKLLQNPEKTKEFIKSVLVLTEEIDKGKYNKIIKNGTLEAWYIKNKIYNLKTGLFPTDQKRVLSAIKSISLMENCPIIQFLRTENIEILNIDATELIKQHKDDDKCLFFLDPPYIQSCNSFYASPDGNIYEYLYNNNISNFKASTYLALEDIWIIRLLFKNNKIFEPYAKTYQMTKKITNHILITK